LFDEIAPFVRNRLKPAMGWTVEHSGAVWAEGLGIACSRVHAYDADPG
jgi:hypothetical protein